MSTFQASTLSKNGSLPTTATDSTYSVRIVHAQSRPSLPVKGQTRPGLGPITSEGTRSTPDSLQLLLAPLETWLPGGNPTGFDGAEISENLIRITSI